MDRLATCVLSYTARVLDLDAARDAVLRELTAFAARAHALAGPEWELPTRCPDWDVRALVAHVAGGCGMYAELCRRMTEGIAEPVTLDALAPPDTGTVRHLLTALEAHRSALTDALGRLPASAAEAPYPHPWLRVDGLAGVNVMAFEEGMHHSDLLAALGEDGTLASDVTAITLWIASGRLPAWAQRGEKPAAPTTILLAGDTARIGLEWGGSAWTVASVPAAPACTIAADDPALALFVCGRIDSRAPGVHVTGDASLAARFKAFFPGP